MLRVHSAFRAPHSEFLEAQMNLGMGELIVIFAIVLLIVGARRLPDLGRSLGEAIREFQDALKGKHDDEQPPEKR